MATVDVGGPTPGAPALPPRPPGGTRRRVNTLLIVLVVLGLCVYGWTNVGGSLSDFFGGFFGSRGIFRSIVGPSLPPASSAIGEGLSHAATTFFVALLSVVFGFIFSIAMLPWAARNLAPNRFCFEVARGISRRSCARSRS